jgi:hypothetical protein
VALRANTFYRGIHGERPRRAQRERSDQIFFEDQRVYSVGIIAWEGFDYAVAVAFVELQGGDVVYRGFEFYRSAARLAQAIFGGGEEERSYAGAAGLGDHVYGDDVTRGATRFGDNETGYGGQSDWRRIFLALSRIGIVCGCFYSQQGKGSAAADVEVEFAPRIGNSGGETLLVDVPQRVEIGGLEIPNGEGHGLL